MSKVSMTVDPKYIPSVNDIVFCEHYSYVLNMYMRFVKNMNNECSSVYIKHLFDSIKNDIFKSLYDSSISPDLAAIILINFDCSYDDIDGLQKTLSMFTQTLDRLRSIIKKQKES